jgi:predicted nucleotidyltransferase
MSDRMNLIFLTIAGSHMYGLNTPESDLDIRGVCLDPVESLLGLTGFEQHIFNQPDNWFSHSYLKEYKLESDDIQIYGLRKFVKLLLENNPNIVEMLFAPSLMDRGLWIGIWKDLINMREYILSDKIKHTFSGYAYSQLARIKGHKRWLDNPPTKPSPDQFGMELTQKSGQRWTDSNLYSQYQSLLKDYNAYLTWQNERNPKRKALEDKFGYDTKHASHLFRLIHEASELLATGYLELPLNQVTRGSVLAIKNGALPYDELLIAAQYGIDGIKDMKSVLRHKPDFDMVDRWLVDTYRRLL